MAERSRGWVDFAVEQMSDAALGKAPLEDDERYFLSEIRDRRAAGDSKISAAELNRLRLLADRMGLNYKVDPGPKMVARRPSSPRGGGSSDAQGDAGSSTPNA